MFRYVPVFIGREHGLSVVVESGPGLAGLSLVSFGQGEDTCVVQGEV